MVKIWFYLNRKCSLLLSLEAIYGLVYLCRPEKPHGRCKQIKCVEDNAMEVTIEKVVWLISATRKYYINIKKN